MKAPFFRTALAALAATALAGCTVGPNFHVPRPPASRVYTATPLPPHTVSAPTAAGGAQHFAFARKLSAQWWKLFRSPGLDSLIKAGLVGNPTLSAAEAALREAAENLRATSGQLLYPGVDANLQAGRERSSGAAFGSPSLEFNLYNASVQVSYLLDVFGSTRRQLEALQAQVDYQRYEYEAAYLTLTANIVTTAIQEAALQAQMKTTRQILAEERTLLRLVRRQFELGAVSKAAVLSQESQLATTAATLPPLQKQLAYSRHALAVLVGKFPSAPNLPQFHLDSLHLPQVLPVTLPSQLVRQRPDIQASLALLHQACAQVGVATANLYPQITLSGSYGFESTDISSLFTPQSVIWNVAGGLAQPIFHGGELLARRRAAIDAYDQAAAQYRQTVLSAFQNVADVLRALDSDALALQAQTRAEKAALDTLQMTREQFGFGAVSYQSLLTAQRDYRRARVLLITAQANRYADTAALFQALGGGWWDRQAPCRTASAQPAAPQTNDKEPVAKRILRVLY